MILSFKDKRTREFAKRMHKIRGQLKLSEKDFKDLIACPLSYEGYLKILKRKGLV